MRINKIAACVLGATMFLQSSALAFGHEKELAILTLENAIEQAKNTSIDLKIHEINYEIAKENTEMARLTGGYYASLTPAMQEEYTRRQEGVLEGVVTMEVMMLFDEIILAEEQGDLQKLNLEINKKELQKAEIEFKKGLTSLLEVQTLKLQNEQMQKDLTKLERDIAFNYEKLCELIGTSSQRYVLDKGEITYTPYKNVKSIDGFASGKAEDHINLWKATEELSVALETPIFTQDYMTVISKKADREIKEKNLERTEQDLEQAIKQKYIDIKQLETSYEMTKKNLELQEKQLKINEIYLEKGMMSLLAYEQSVLSYEKALLNLMQLESQHTLLAYQLDNPYLISMN